MKADIWMPFYIGDYHRDTMHLSTLEHGAYRLLIDAYWCQGGPLPDDDEELCRITKLLTEQWSVIRKRIAKFFIVENGVWRHKRVDYELERSKAIKQAKSEAGKRGMEVRWNNRAITEPLTNTITKNNPSPSPSPSLSNLPQYAKAPKSVDEVKTWASMDGIAPEEAERFFHHFESSGWIDRNGHPILNPRSKLKVWATDQRAGEAEKNHHAQSGGDKAPSFWELSKKLEHVESEIKQIEMRASHTTTDMLIQPKDKESYKKLRANRRELKEKLNLQ